SFVPLSVLLFFSPDAPTSAIYTLSLHDALPIYSGRPRSSPRTPSPESRVPLRPRGSSESPEAPPASRCRTVDASRRKPRRDPARSEERRVGKEGRDRRGRYEHKNRR